MQRELKVLLIEDHPLVRDGCRRIFGLRKDITLTEASSAAAGLEANAALLPDLVLLDISLPDRDGLEIIAPLLAANSDVNIIMLSMHTTLNVVDRAFERGVRGYLSKTDSSLGMIEAIDQVLQGTRYVGPTVSRRLAAERTPETHNPLSALTLRERKIVAQLGNGRSLAEVSAASGLSCKTVANAVTLIKHKLKTPTTSALITLAVEHATSAF